MTNTAPYNNCRVRNLRRVPAVVAALLSALAVCVGCASVPRASVQLSTTVGRDIDEVYRAHRELAVLLYTRIKNDVNRFVDDVYAPFQISKLLQADQGDFRRGDENSLFAALNEAVQNPDIPAPQSNAVLAMDIFVEVVREAVESFRAERLAPVLVQEQRLLSDIDESYKRIHYANSIVTGHLASIIAVHDAQEDVLSQFGAGGLRATVGQALAETSNRVATFVEEARGIEGTIAEVEQMMSDLTNKLDEAVRIESTAAPAEPR